ncbi:hypothetical protein BO94DRAFT_613549 [Aspergillus sclerotioniger CBS 115572]|uniref:Uncharacterized protein n=1 Tax=Aspergillus sclerotioniger CBS 115572 TaxID=1450535 RepID=A0A317V219_9EURO|nr:hypothetical protein BO94DRAFT_613549 [Aspergillus sclerotioniger CBS 115572]PWY66812.1 hypothetical protein BO94DRAFT_613549 [Aspergillus sclerotioniger CBS 115572]
MTIVSLDKNKDELVYTFKSDSDIKGEAETANRSVLPEPSKYPLALVRLLNKVIVITMGLPYHKIWGKHADLICQALEGGRLSLSQGENEYIKLNHTAINEEAKEENKCLAERGCKVKAVAVADWILLGIWPQEDRPFRLYRGCTLVLRGKKFFDKEQAKGYMIPGEKGAPEDWMASVTGESLKWRSLIDAPVQAILKNNVDTKLVDQIQEDDAKVHPVSNHVVQIAMLQATRKLSEHWGEENFDIMCQEFEAHGATIPSGSNKKLPLASMFLASTPRVNTHDPLISSPTDLSTLVPTKKWGLNEAQLQATTQLLTHSFSLVVGPPGTGKTRTIAAATMFITQVLRHESISGRVKNAFEEFNQQRRELIKAVMRDVRVVVTLPLNCKEMLRREFNPQFKYHQTLLNISYRSHHIIYHSTSAAYYKGKVRTVRDRPSTNVCQENPLLVTLGNETWTLPGLSHFLHLAHVSNDTKKDFSGSLYHPREAELGIALARSLIDRGFRDVLIISPYKAQVALVKKLWEQRYPNAMPIPRAQTVDASQGSEAPAVIVLITRNFGSAGFLQSTKRTNLMLSRARTAQYVVGNWAWVGGKSFKDGGKFHAYSDDADKVLDKRTEYSVSPKLV